MIAWGGKALPYLVASAVALAAVALLGLAISRLDGMLDKARQEAAAARDAHWQAEIAKANARMSSAEASLARLAMQRDAELAEAERKFKDQQDEMEAQNAALPGGDGCGLSRDRVRLLNQR